MMRSVAIAGLVASALLASCAASPSQREQAAIDHYVRGAMLAYDNRNDAALVELARSAELDPGMSTTHAAMGDIYRKRNAALQAAQAYQRACEANPYSFRNHYNLGVIWQGLAQAAQTADEVRVYVTQAVEVYLRAITLRPADFDANLNLGVCYYQVGKLEKAEQYCRIAIALKPNDPDAYTNLGAISDAQGNSDGAIQAYRRSLDYNPQQPRVLVNLGLAYLKLGQTKQATRDFELAAGMDPSSPIPQERLGYCLFLAQDYGRSAECYRKAIALDARFAEAHRGLGVVHMTQYLKDPRQAELRDQALAEWGQSLQINPDQPDLVKLLDKYRPTTTPPVPR